MCQVPAGGLCPGKNPEQCRCRPSAVPCGIRRGRLDWRLTGRFALTDRHFVWRPGAQSKEKEWPLSVAEIGREGEKRATRLLRSRGYRILARNYGCRHGEIDIVAFESGEIVFVEVKARTSEEKGTALEAVTVRKQKKIARVAEQFLIERNLSDRPCRFDVVAIAASPDAGGDEIIKGAFFADSHG